MRIIVLITYLQLSTILNSQILPEKDSIVTFLLVSQYNYVDKPFLKLFKSCKDIGIIVNAKDENLYLFRNGYPEYYGKIEKFEYDSIGRMYIELTFTFKRHVGDVSIPGKIWFNYGNDFFITLIEGKMRKHDLFNFEFKKESVF